MSVNSYLENLAKNLIIRDDEKDSIKRSFDTLKMRLENYFGYEIGFVKKFGSYHRDTILPRKYDENSDVDVMVLFNDDSYTPQTYLNRLRRFVERWYSRSEIYQSNPTIVLELNHIKFELVPCIKAGYYENGNYKIPAKASNYSKWILTSPFEFSDELTAKNKLHNSKIKPLIRIMKKWNAKSKAYSSFELEQKIIDCYFDYRSSTIADYLYDLSSYLIWHGLPDQAYKRDNVEKLISQITQIKNYEYQYPDWATATIREIFE
ncbi:SMODS domain-containing nucleotidyltransferase [Avibacterium avium]|uniref:SMODS domain-containing nucleotidyltransferase n=1 Tax=Avibacterium avium TaxID=751 RepID=UPI003BF7B5F0